MRGQPLASACTRSRAPLKRLWSPTVGPVEVYCHIVWKPQPHGQLADRRVVPGHPQRVGGAEARVVAGAVLPPAGRGVDHRVPSGARPVGVREVADPVDHRRLAEPVALGAVRIPLDVQHARQGPPVPRPAAPVVHEVVRLCGAARRVRGGEVVRAADHADAVRTVVLLREVGVLVVRPLGGLHIGPLHAAVPEGPPVHVALVAADVDPLGLGGPGVARRTALSVVLDDTLAQPGGAARGAVVGRGGGGGRAGQGQEEGEGGQERSGGGEARTAGRAGRAGSVHRHERASEVGWGPGGAWGAGAEMRAGLMAWCVHVMNGLRRRYARRPGVRKRARLPPLVYSCEILAELRR